MMATPSGGSSTTCSPKFRQLRRCSRERYTLTQPAHAALTDAKLERSRFGRHHPLQLGPVPDYGLDRLTEPRRTFAREQKKCPHREFSKCRELMVPARD